MIIYGTRGKEKAVGNGQFHCPRCGADQPYEQTEVRQYFTLYFIPVIPMGKQREYITCGTCAGTYAMEILTYDPEEERRKTVESFRRLAVLFLLDINRCTATTMGAIVDILGDTFNVDVEREDIAEDVMHAQNAAVDAKKFFKKETADFSDDGKILLLIRLRQILESEGNLQPHERDRIVEIGKATGVRKKNVEEVLDMDLSEDAEE